MAKIKDRIIEYLKINGITKQDFCEKTGISYANMVGKSLQSEFGGEQIYEILHKFPELNPDWLMLGKGEMLRSGSPKPASSTPADNDLVLKILAEKDRRIEQLILEKHELEQRLDTVLRVSADIQSVAPPQSAGTQINTASNA